jgi:hypothetical protein
MKETTMTTQITPGQLLNPSFNYITAARTDIAKTFERHGHVRPDVKRQQATRLLLNGFDLTALDPDLIKAQASLL